MPRHANISVGTHLEHPGIAHSFLQVTFHSHFPLANIELSGAAMASLHDGVTGVASHLSGPQQERRPHIFRLSGPSQNDCGGAAVPRISHVCWAHHPAAAARLFCLSNIFTFRLPFFHQMVYAVAFFSLPLNDSTYWDLRHQFLPRGYLHHGGCGDRSQPHRAYCIAAIVGGHAPGQAAAGS